MDPENTSAEPEGLDIEAAVADIAEHLLPPSPADAAPPADGSETPGEESAESEPKLATAAPAPVAAVEKAPPADAGDTGADRPPDTWTKEGKELWATLPAGVKAEVARREENIAKFVSDHQPAIGVAKAFEQIVSPFMERYNRDGVDPWKLTQDMHKVHNMLAYGSQEERVAVLQTLARQVGIDLGKLPAAEAPVEDPRVVALQRRVDEMSRGVQAVSSQFREAQVNELTERVMEFIQDAEAHPYANDLLPDMTKFISSGMAKSVQEAYDMALYQNPSTREKVLKSELEKREAAHRAEAAEKAKAAKKASAANVKSQGKGRPTSLPGSIDDTLRETLNEINSR